MLTFSRNRLISVEPLDESTFLCHGILDDYIYNMELDVEIKLPDFKITAISGIMKRITTSECQRAEGKLKNAIGLSALSPDFEAKVKRIVGRQGCRHFADLLMECCDSLMQLITYGGWQQVSTKDSATKDAFWKKLLESTPSLRNSCSVYADNSPLMKKLGIKIRI